MRGDHFKRGEGDGHAVFKCIIERKLESSRNFGVCCTSNYAKRRINFTLNPKFIFELSFLAMFAAQSERTYPRSTACLLADLRIPSVWRPKEPALGVPFGNLRRWPSGFGNYSAFMTHHELQRREE